MKPRKEYYQTTAKELIKKLEKRRMEAYYCDNKEEAVAKIMELLSKGASVSWGGSMTLEELELKPKIIAGNYEVYDRSGAETEEEKEQIYHWALNCDYYLMSANAITKTGKLINIDGRGNRLAALVYGPKNVIVTVGMNKLTPDEKTARLRVKEKAAPINAMRLDRETPCVEKGSCFDCLGDSSICSQTVITRRSHVKNRIKVVLIGERLGY